MLQQIVKKISFAKEIITQKLPSAIVIDMVPY